ncbi:MAG TPA: PIN domain-containing protein [Phycisphaerae bacterium]|nr:PIN domain-containing protein [Phycisphaerae bacterium]
MRPLFADTSLFVSYVNPDEDCHASAVEYLTRRPEPIVTTTWVLAELGNFLARSRHRSWYVSFVRDLRTEPRLTVVGADEASFDRGLRLYAQTPDKTWSAIDCISFAVMRERRIRQALTSDHHFEQAGFTLSKRDSRSF